MWWASFDLVTFLMVYFFPVQFMVGVVGNTLNLIVLLNRRMRTRTNVLLAILALTDILFLFFMLPHSLTRNVALMKNHSVRVFFVYTGFHLAGLSNMCSFISAWLIVLLTVERMSAVIWPLKSRLFWTCRTLRFFVISILVASILTSVHFHIAFKVTASTRNDTVVNSSTGITEVIERPVIRPMLRQGWEKYWRISTLFDTFLVVFIPVSIVACASTCIIYSLQRKPLPDLKKGPYDIQIKLLNTGRHSNRGQRRATLIVTVIAFLFTTCHLPSAITHIFLLIKPDISENPRFLSATTLTDSLVVTTKTLNLFLFCMWGANFRRQLHRIIISKLQAIKMTHRQSCSKEEEMDTRITYGHPTAASRRSLPILTWQLKPQRSLSGNMDSNNCRNLQMHELFK